MLRHEGFDVKLLDANSSNLSLWEVREWVRQNRDADWIIFRSTPSTFYEDVKIVKIAKYYEILTLMLNWNLHYVKDRVMKECPDLDIYLNEYHYEYVIPKILDKFPWYSRSNLPKTFDIPEPTWDLIEDFSRYYTRTRWFSPWVVVRGSKGCPFGCKFCVDSYTGWFPRSPELIGDELEYLSNDRNVKYISFFDNTFEVNADWCLAIASEIEKRNLKFKWYINSRADLICKHGVEFFKVLKEAGCDGSSIGIEFGTDTMLEASDKGTTVEQGKEAIDILHKSGIKSYASCMMGYDGESEEQMIKTMEFIKETKPTGFQINPVFVPIGSELHNELSLDADVRFESLSCVPTHVLPLDISQLSAEEVMELRKKFYKKIYLSRWLLYNFFRLRGWSDVKLGFGYFLSSMGRLLKGVEFSH